MSDPVCPYCKRAAILTSGAMIYMHRRDLADKLFWECVPCHAWVGCRPGTSTPLGCLADAPLRAARKRAHNVFDPVWKTWGMNRRSAYEWLAYELDIPVRKCHIGMFDLEMCRRVILLCNSRNAINTRTAGEAAKGGGYDPTAG